jgi:hypothetical protein
MSTSDRTVTCWRGDSGDEVRCLARVDADRPARADGPPRAWDPPPAWTTRDVGMQRQLIDFEARAAMKRRGETGLDAYMGHAARFEALLAEAREGKA